MPIVDTTYNTTNKCNGFLFKTYSPCREDVRRQVDTLRVRPIRLRGYLHGVNCVRLLLMPCTRSPHSRVCLGVCRCMSVTPGQLLAPTSHPSSHRSSLQCPLPPHSLSVRSLLHARFLCFGFSPINCCSPRHSLFHRSLYYFVLLV